MILSKIVTSEKCPVCNKGKLMELIQSKDYRLRKGFLITLGSQKEVYCSKCKYGVIEDDRDSISKKH